MEENSRWYYVWENRWGQRVFLFFHTPLETHVFMPYHLGHRSRNSKIFEDILFRRCLHPSVQGRDAGQSLPQCCSHEQFCHLRVVCQHKWACNQQRNIISFPMEGIAEIVALGFNQALQNLGCRDTDVLHLIWSLCFVRHSPYSLALEHKSWLHRMKSPSKSIPLK